MEKKENLSPGKKDKRKTIKKKPVKTKRSPQKLSPQVIQSVIVKVGEEKKARKARRQQRRINRKDLEAIQEQQINSKVSPVVVYQTGAPFQQPQPVYNFAQEASQKNIKTKGKPEYIEIDRELEFITTPTKKEQLTELIDPVAEATNTGESLKSAIYTRHVFPKEKVEGNYAFGKFDESSSDTSSINTVSGITQPAGRVMSLGEWVSQNGTEARYATDPDVRMERVYEPSSQFDAPGEAMATSQNPLAKKARKPNRPKEEIYTAYKNELKRLILEGGIAEEEAEQYSNVPRNTAQFKEAIRRQKLANKLNK
jgi:hypothetical protein